MEYRIVIIISLLFISIESIAQIDLSKKARIYLLTCASGDELYSTFGHSAIWVYDDSLRVDRIYNYGTFDFHTPNFYGKFAHGKLDYMLSVSNIEYFMKEYQYFNRSVFSQELNLDSLQISKVYNYLEKNAQPENRYYRYDFFYDNCATRIRDVFQKVLGDSLKFFLTDKKISFRTLIKPCLVDKPWEKLGLDIILGRKTDKIASPIQYLLLPDYVRDAFAGAKLQTRNGSVNFVKSSREIFTSVPLPKEKPGFFLPTRVFSSLFLLIILFTYFGNRRRKIYHIIDIPLFLVTGLLGIVLTYLWFFSDHKLIANNWNVLWAFPFNFFMAFTLFKKRKSTFTTNYFLVYGILMFLLVATWYFLPQKMNISLMAIALSLGLRSVFIYARAKDKKL